jgi:hypothetical protein
MTTVTTTNLGLSEKVNNFLRRQENENFKKKNTLGQISTDASYDRTVL